jgi:hypothetical protein
MKSVIHTVSGHAVVAAWGGPDNFLNVDSKGWTDQQGLCQDDGRRFRIRGGKLVDFYIPFTNPVIVDDVRFHADFAAVTFQLSPTAVLTSFQVWDRTTNVFTSPPLAITGNYRRRWSIDENAFVLPFDAAVQGSLAIKVSMSSTDVAEVIFTGAGLKFHAP